MNRISILIIDDEPSNIHAIIEILNHSGSDYRMLSASTAALGFKIAVTIRPDIILTDWSMPDMDGIQLIEKLKSEPISKDIPVIMVTGVYMTATDLKVALERGAFDFVRKPIDDTELIARINSALRTIDYYNQKVQAEKLAGELILERNKNEIDLKKRELLAYTSKLHHIVQIYEEFSEYVASEKCKGCALCVKAQQHADQMTRYSNQQIWKELEMQLFSINDQFLIKLSASHPSLTTNEKKLCGYLLLNLTTKEIASITRQTVRGVEIARTRLREKFGLKGSSEDLNDFLRRI